MKNKAKHHAFGTVPKFNEKIVERGKIDTLTHKYMTTCCSGLIQTLKYEKNKDNRDNDF